VSDVAVVRDAELLAAGCRELEIELTPEQLDQQIRYLELLYVWNRSAGLTTIPRAEAIRLHLLDSLAATHAWSSGPCLDLGAGGGLPGIPLAIARPAEGFLLVESNRRKCSFLLEAIRAVGLANVRVMEGDYERFQPGERFPTVISRAFRPPAEFLAIAKRFVAPTGQVVLLLADPADEEIAALAEATGVALETFRRVRLPGGGEPRTVVTFRSR
jgi:16S rRNA (guanine527-N7)-methyltransferase